MSNLLDSVGLIIFAECFVGFVALSKLDAEDYVLSI